MGILALAIHFTMGNSSGKFVRFRMSWVITGGNFGEPICFPLVVTGKAVLDGLGVTIGILATSQT